MSRAKSVEIEGLDKLVRDLDKFGDKALPYLQSATRYSARVIAKDAKNNIRHISGDLARSVTLDPNAYDDKAKNIAASAVWLDNDIAPYAPHVELGHGYKRGENNRETGRYATGSINDRSSVGFLRRAADKNKKIVSSQIINAMNRAIRELSQG